METKSPKPYNAVEIAELYNLINNADTIDEACRLLLSKLGFIEDNSSDNYYSRIISWIRSPKDRGAAIVPVALFFIVLLVGVVAHYRYSSPLLAGVNPVTGNAGVVAVLVAASAMATFVIAFLGYWVGYERWQSAEENRNVDDIIKRKELTNKMMVDNSTVLLPYVGSSFDVEKQYAETLLAEHDRFTAQMYVFTEIDNLEFVFDKSKSELIRPKHTLRAIKIFLARCENVSFEREAGKLVQMGRYNRQFVRCVETLLDVGNWSRTRATCGPSGPTS